MTPSGKLKSTSRYPKNFLTASPHQIREKYRSQVPFPHFYHVWNGLSRCTTSPEVRDVWNTIDTDDVTRQTCSRVTGSDVSLTFLAFVFFLTCERGMCSGQTGAIEHKQNTFRGLSHCQTYSRCASPLDRDADQRAKEEVQVQTNGTTVRTFEA